MKVLKNNYNEIKINKEEKRIPPYPRQIICENCQSELEYEKSDMEMGVYGAMHLRCPLCNYNNMLDDNECSITLTMDNVEFPIHFCYTSKENGAVDICTNEEIRERIKEGINFFRKNKEKFYWFSETGNLHIDVRRCPNDETYDVVVTNNYYSTYIPFESEDYGVSF